MSHDAWRRLVLECDDDATTRELARTLLISLDANTVEEQDTSTLPSTYDDPLSEGQVRFVAYLQAPHADSLPLLREQFALALRTHTLTNATGRVEPFDDTSWRDGWRAFFKPAQVSPRLAIRTPWVEFDAADHVHVLVIEPGMAFGTGLHETTQLCLQALDDLCHPAPERLLDVGCGSGILSIGAVKLGVSNVLGLDIDPIAADVSAENATRNDVAHATHFDTTPVAAIQDTYPIVVANILASILTTLRDDLIATLAPGGRLILSGILEEEHTTLAAHFCDNTGLVLDRAEHLGPWSMLVLHNPIAGTN